MELTMPWVRFIKPFDYVVRDRLVLVYKAGQVYLVMQACAQRALAQGSAVLVKRPEKDDASRRR
jgi:hypothetical protein